MNEIELKAHVTDRAMVIEKLNSFARYDGHTEKSDTYYTFPLSGERHVSARIREERSGSTETCFLTYKRKELRSSEGGKGIEVNEEHECTVSSPDALCALFEDAGARITLKKQKLTEHWQFEQDGKQAHIELCTVPPLGDFLEIEIMEQSGDEQTVAQCRRIEEGILEKCGIPLSQLEPRYYRDLLQTLNFC